MKKLHLMGSKVSYVYYVLLCVKKTAFVSRASISDPTDPTDQLQLLMLSGHNDSHSSTNSEILICKS